MVLMNVILIFSCFLMFSVIGWAQSTPSYTVSGENNHYGKISNYQMLAPALLYSMPTDVMQKGRKEFKIIPGYGYYEGSDESGGEGNK